jgi:hypothetical protein
MWDNFIGKIAVDVPICPVKSSHLPSVPQASLPQPSEFHSYEMEGQLMEGCSFQSDNRYEAMLSSGK